MGRVKLTITVDGEVLARAKEEARRRNVTLSRVVENFLRFFSNPEVYCFSCGERFSARSAEVCARCGWLICPHCGACRCGLGDEAAVAVFHMRRVYEDLLSGRVR